MQRASKLFQADQLQAIERAVSEAEAQTSCELVPVVATSSGRYDRSEDLVGLWCSVVAACAVWLILPRDPHESGTWDGLPLGVGLLAMGVSVVLAFVIGTMAASRIAPLRRLFTHRQQMHEEVSARAREVFFDRRVHHTGGSTGVLFYVSLFEHRAVVFADQAVLDKLGQPFLDRLCQQLTADLHRGSAVDALTNVIREAGTQLSGPFPRAATEVNELHDALVLID